MAEKGSQGLPVEYDPEKHDGLLCIGGKDIIIADARQAKLGEMPEEFREPLIKSTKEELALLHFSLHEGSVIIEPTNPGKATQRMEGLIKGLKLLGVD